MKKINFNYKTATKWFLIIYMAIVLMLSIMTKPFLSGESLSHVLPAVAIINRFKVTITQVDIEKAKTIFPDWANDIDNLKISPFTAKNGEKMGWYFPTYAIATVPIILLLLLLKAPTTHAFVLTNLFFFFIMLYMVYSYSKLSDKKKFFLIAILSINPIIFYMVLGADTEVFIYSFLSMALIFYINKEYKKAVIFLSIASTLNPTILAVAFFMIFDYLYQLIGTSEKLCLHQKLLLLLKKWKDILKYAACYSVALIPFIYNYYNIGYINPTAKLFVPSIGSINEIIERMLAYLFDLNFGFLPYFNILLIFSFILVIISFIKKEFKFPIIMIAFLSTVFAYSTMVHINSGALGIARYNSWWSPFLIFPIVVYSDKILFYKNTHPIKFLQFIPQSFFIIYLFVSVAICYSYNPNLSGNKLNYRYMTPIASYVLNNYPYLYNPLPSTFNSRVMHIDGGYEIKTPIFYKNEEGNITKILASEKDKDALLLELGGTDIGNKWLAKKINDLTDKNSYISISPKYNIRTFPHYTLGKQILFNSKNTNCYDYIDKGIFPVETNWAWTEGKLLKMSFCTADSSNYKNMHATFYLKYIYRVQTITVLVNKNVVFSTTLNNGDVEFLNYGRNFEFDFPSPRDGKILLEIELPNAVAPSKIEKGASDNRVIAIALEMIVFTGTN